MRESEYGINSVQVLNMSHFSGCPANDCEFVNLAKDLDGPLITEDQQVLRSFSGLAISMDQYLETY